MQQNIKYVVGQSQKHTTSPKAQQVRNLKNAKSKTKMKDSKQQYATTRQSTTEWRIAQHESMKAKQGEEENMSEAMTKG